MRPIERAARALGEVYDGCADPQATPNNWARAQEGVRAVLQAIREPSEGMVEAGDGDFDIYWCYRADGRPGGPEDVWRAMIDAALTE